MRVIRWCSGRRLLFGLEPWNLDAFLHLGPGEQFDRTVGGILEGFDHQVGAQREQGYGILAVMGSDRDLAAEAHTTRQLDQRGARSTRSVLESLHSINARNQ